MGEIGCGEAWDEDSSESTPVFVVYIGLGTYTVHLNIETIDGYLCFEDTR